MGIIKRNLIHWKKAMFTKMVTLDSELVLQNGVFVEEVDKLIYAIGKREKEIAKQWEETCDILSNPKLMKGITNSLEDVRKGKYYVLEKDDEGNIVLTKGIRWKKKLKEVSR